METIVKSLAKEILNLSSQISIYEASLSEVHKKARAAFLETGERSMENEMRIIEENLDAAETKRAHYREALRHIRTARKENFLFNAPEIL